MRHWATGAATYEAGWGAEPLGLWGFVGAMPGLSLALASSDHVPGARVTEARESRWVKAAHDASAARGDVGTSMRANQKTQARGGGAGTSRVREGCTASRGQVATWGRGGGRMNPTMPPGGDGGNVIVRSCSSPLHDSAETVGPGQDDFAASPLVAQHDAPPDASAPGLAANLLSRQMPFAMPQ